MRFFIVLLTSLVWIAAPVHDPPRYADDIYDVGKHHVYTQQLCHDGHGTVIHTITTEAYGIISLEMGGLVEWGYAGEIVKDGYGADLTGDVLIWDARTDGARIVVIYTGHECLIRFPVVEE